MKKLAVLGDFLEPHHHAQIDSTAARCGFAVDYYPDGHVPAELAGQYEVLYGMPDRAALRTFTSLKWFCGSFAGVDAYLDDALYPSPDVILTNSSGAYGVTIAEHLIMVTLMLLRHASAYVLEAAAHRWGPSCPCVPSWAAPSPWWAPATSAPSSPAAPRLWAPSPFAASAAP